MLLYPNQWDNKDINNPFDMAGFTMFRPTMTDEGSVATALAASDLSALIDNDNTTPIRVKDYLGTADLTLTERYSVLFSMMFGMPYQFYSAMLNFNAGFNSDIPTVWHLVPAQDCLLKQSADYAFDKVKLDGGYTDFVYTKAATLTGLTGVSLTDCTNLNLGVQVGTSEYVQGARQATMYQRSVEAIGIIATNLNTIADWDVWGSLDNSKWTHLDKSVLNSDGWENGEIYYPSFRSSGYGCRIIKFAKSERYVYFKATNNRTTASVVYKVFALNLTGDMGASQDGQKFQYFNGTWSAAVEEIVDSPALGAVVAKYSSYGTTGNQTQKIAGISLAPSGSRILLGDASLRKIKVLNSVDGTYIAEMTSAMFERYPRAMAADTVTRFTQSGTQRLFSIMNSSVTALAGFSLIRIFDLATYTETTTLYSGSGVALRGVATNDDSLFVSYSDATNIYLAIHDLDNPKVVQQIKSKTLTNTTTLFPCGDFGMSADDDTVYGFDYADNTQFVGVHTTDLSTKFTATSWVEESTQYTLRNQNARLVGVADDYAYFIVRLSSLSTYWVTSYEFDLLKVKISTTGAVDTLSYTDRRAFDSTYGAHSLINNTESYNFGYVSHDNDYLYVPNCRGAGPSTPDSFVTVMHKQYRETNQKSYLEFRLDGKSYKALRYKLDPLSNDMTAATEFANIYVFNDPNVTVPTDPKSGNPTKKWTIKSGIAGEISPQDKFIVKLTTTDVPTSFQTFTGREYHSVSQSVNLSVGLVFDATRSYFYLSDTARRITECRRILNSTFDGVGSSINSSVAFTSGLTSEVNPGYELNSGEYSVNYELGQVVYFNGPTATVTATFKYAREPFGALEYRLAGNSPWRSFGVPDAIPVTNPAIAVECRSNLTNYDERQRLAYMVFVAWLAQGTSLFFGVAGYVLVDNAFARMLDDYLAMQQSTGRTVDLFQVRNQYFAQSLDKALSQNPYHTIDIDKNNVRNASNDNSFDMAVVKSEFNAQVLDTAHVKLQYDTKAVDELPIVIRETNRERAVDYTYDRSRVVSKRRRT